MPRGLPKYRKHPNGQAFVQHRSIPTADHRQYLGVYGSEESKRKYQQFLGRLMAAQVEEAPANPPASFEGDDLPIVVLIALYLRHAREYYAVDGQPSDEFDQMRHALLPLDKLFGDELANDFGPKKLKLLRQHLVKSGLSRTTINHRIQRVRRFFRWAVSEELVKPGLAHGLEAVAPLQKGKTAAKEQPKVRPVELSWVQATIPYLSPQVAAMVQVQLLCGMRPQDVTHMRLCDIHRDGEIWLYRPHRHKNDWRGQELIKAIPQAAQGVLRPFLDRDESAYLFSPAEAYQSIRKRRPRASVGEKYDTAAYRRAVKYGIAKANKARVKEQADSGVREDQVEAIPNWSPNQLRHSISTIMAEMLGQQKAQRWLGHAHLDTTSIYTEIVVSEITEIARELDRRWTGLQSPQPERSANGGTTETH